MVEHQINNDTGDRHIQPDWKGPPGNRAMTKKLAAQRSSQGHDDKRHHSNRQNRV